MRPEDRAEIFGLLETDNPLELAAMADALVRNRGRGRMAWSQGKPCAVAALTEARPGVWEVTMFGTSAFRAGVVPLMRWFREETRSILTTCKGHRLQCDSRADHHEGHKLIRAMGGRQEGDPMREYGKDRADYIRFVWLRAEDAAILDKHYVQQR